MNFDMPKAVFCGLALIAAAIALGNGSTPSHAAFSGDVGRYACANHECSSVIDTKTSEVRWSGHKGKTVNIKGYHGNQWVTVTRTFY